MAEFPEPSSGQGLATLGQKMGWGHPPRQADALFEKSQNENVAFPFRGKIQNAVFILILSTRVFLNIGISHRKKMPYLKQL